MLLLSDGIEVRGRSIGCFPSCSYLLFVKCQQYVGSCMNSLLLTEVTYFTATVWLCARSFGWNHEILSFDFYLAIQSNRYRTQGNVWATAMSKLEVILFLTEIHKKTPANMTFPEERKDWKSVLSFKISVLLDQLF